MNKGDIVSLKFDPKNTKDVIIAETFSDIWGGILGLFFMGFVFSIVGGMNYYLRR